jgi:hypothetical protein
MIKNIALKSKKFLSTLSFYLFWLFLVALGAVVAFQLQITFVYLGYLLIQSPLRPVGWNTSTLSGISRCGYLVFALLWLVLVLSLGRYLSAGLDEGRLGFYFLRLALILGGVYLFCAALMYVLG